MNVPVLLVTGSLGSGKTAVLGEASDILRERDISHAALDLDALCVLHPHPPNDRHADTVAWKNLESVWANFSSLGIERLLIARVIEQRGELDEYRRVIPGAQITIARLMCALPVMQERIATRDLGRELKHLQRRSAEVERILDEAAALEDFRVDNTDRLIGDVAEDVLARAGWL